MLKSSRVGWKTARNSGPGCMWHLLLSSALVTVLVTLCHTHLLNQLPPTWQPPEGSKLTQY